MKLHEGLLVALALTSPGAVLAQDDPQERERGYTTEEERRMREQAEEAWQDVKTGDERGKGFNVRAMAGPVAYTGDAATVTTPGATYGVNAGWDFSRFIGAELGYQGQVYGSSPAVGGERDTLLENGGQALAKVRTDIGNFVPYAMGGLGISWLTGASAQSAGLVENDTLFRLPLGAGVDYRFGEQGAGNVTLGVRGVYQLGLDSGAFPTQNNATSSSQLMGVASLGGNW
ncbi:MAG: porin family protein [Myxococcaceae bacterium]|nr:porin family protein [Myxococcaceae bacterium]MCI0669210.1 porin family protein [Myxococcaceae bacterium]